ncbi:hypothetical protein I5E68_01790 [Novosphingobium sp. YJ-S2-02]|uniref:Uncharacterized protein n=1 Tax=Novosphingobium aureum TaxID=2792964 RepID=A0A931MJC8_9SPHN|nr:hypothetical protein [Novosphingobium aureum]MBH0111682.1 hypothetical protein [Novosphingobium aureum]
MKRLLGLACLIGVCTSAPAQAASEGRSCGLDKVKTVADLRGVLSMRAIEAIKLAAEPRGYEESPGLKALIRPDAAVGLGSGDVGRPLGHGTYGLRHLVREMNAGTYRYLNWDYIPTPVDQPCHEAKVEIEFTDSARLLVYPVEFTFEDGLITGVSGWTRSYVSGNLWAQSP